MAGTIEDIWQSVLDINQKLDDLPSLWTITAPQIVVTSLEEISGVLGLIRAGEFRAGNGRDIGDSFSGVRMGYPPFSYPITSTESTDLYNIVGVDADTLQFGIGASDGVLYAGAGAVTMDALGINFIAGQGQSNRLTWTDTTEFFSELLSNDSTMAYIGFHSAAEDSDAQLISRLRLKTEGISTASTQSHNSAIQLYAYHADATVPPTGGPVSLELYAGGAGSDYVNIVGNQLDRPGFLIAEDGFHMNYHFSTARSFDFNFWADDADLDPITASDHLPSFFLGDLNRAVIFGGNTTDDEFNMAILDEKALTLASTATAGIEDPDNEMVKLWVDTNAELRMTDTAGNDWYITKNNDTGST